MGYHRNRERETDGQKERERRREDAVLYMKTEGKSLIDVKQVETTGERCFTYIYVNHTNVFEADNTYKCSALYENGG